MPLHLTYEFSWPFPHSHLLRISLHVEGAEHDTIDFQLPVWRPGRYELGRFERNIKYVRFIDEQGAPLPCQKISRNQWRVQLGGRTAFRVEYEYYAAELNAGSTYVDDEMVLINFVNCCLYPPNIPAAYTIRIPATEGMRVATPLPPTGSHEYSARDYDHLFDNFLFASPTLTHHTFYHRGLETHLWIHGPVSPPHYQMEDDFIRFMDEALAIFGSYPIRQYHFLYIFPPYRKYHGVEHQEGTVIVLGPPHQLFERKLGERFYTYKQLLGISAHEFFHLWNVKAIRPQELYPIDYSKENYSRLGFFLEGVTTYYGELLLLRSGLLTFQSWAKDFSRILNAFFANYGRFNKTLAESSFDLWVDGYRPHIPHRTTSIYTHGALVAFLLDIHLRQHSEGTASFDSLMRFLYENYAQQHKGFPLEALESYLREHGGPATAAILHDYVFGMKDIEPALAEALAAVGVHLRKEALTDYRGRLGMRVGNDGTINYLVPFGPAEQAGLAYHDRIVAINGIQPSEQDYAEWLDHHVRHHAAIELAVIRAGRLLTLSVPVGESPQMFEYTAVPDEQSTPLRDAWLSRKVTEDSMTGS